MPYTGDKGKIYNSTEVEKIVLDTAGDLNRVFTEFSLRYIRAKGLKYQHINDVVGALEGAKLELYRRLAAPYEDLKIKENGDVY